MLTVCYFRYCSIYEVFLLQTDYLVVNNERIDRQCAGSVSLTLSLAVLCRQMRFCVSICTYYSFAYNLLGHCLVVLRIKVDFPFFLCVRIVGQK